MTHGTDAERAEFEAWVKETQKLDDGWWCRQLPDGGCSAGNVDAAWKAWQAARRAPAATVPQGYDSGVQTGNRVTLAFDTQSNATAWFEKFCDDYDAAAGTKTIKLPIPADAAPQPPEAAPDCRTCNDHGAVGNILNAEPCPDCTMKRGAGCSVSNGETQTAPVQLPEPVATLHCNDECYVWARASDAGKRMRFDQPLALYTEQQVRELLAAHGTKVNQ